MAERMSAEQVFTSIKGTRDSLSVSRSFGDAYVVDGVTVIPVARVAGGAGGGGGEGVDEAGESGGGFGTGFGLGILASPFRQGSEEAGHVRGDLPCLVGREIGIDGVVGAHREGLQSRCAGSERTGSRHTSLVGGRIGPASHARGTRSRHHRFPT